MKKYYRRTGKDTTQYCPKCKTPWIWSGPRRIEAHKKGYAMIKCKNCANVFKTTEGTHAFTVSELEKMKND